MNTAEIKTVLIFQDPTLNRVFGKMESTKEHRADVRAIYRTCRNEGVTRPEARLIGLGVAMAHGFWTGTDMA